jgi:hypothetical protein
MTQTAGLMAVAEYFYTVSSTTILSMIVNVYAVAFLHCLVKPSNLPRCVYSLSFLFLFLASAAIDLLKQIKEKDEMSTYMVVDQVFFFEIDLVGHQDT